MPGWMDGLDQRRCVLAFSNDRGARLVERLGIGQIVQPTGLRDTIAVKQHVHAPSVVGPRQQLGEFLEDLAFGFLVQRIAAPHFGDDLGGTLLVSAGDQGPGQGDRALGGFRPGVAESSDDLLRRRVFPDRARVPNGDARRRGRASP